jgi:excisionase family DNA binding protein
MKGGSSTGADTAAPAGWLPASAAAAHLVLPSVAALYKRVERGQVPAHRWGRQFRFRTRDLDALMESGAAPVSARCVVSPLVCPVADLGGR